MKHKLLWTVLLIMAVLLAAGCENKDMGGSVPPTGSVTPTEPTQETKPTEPPKVTDPTIPTDPEELMAPDVTIYTEDLETVKLSDYLGKPVVLNFWASWCPPCKAEMPEFDAKYLEIGDEVQFLMVNVTRSDYFQDANHYIKEQGYRFPVFYDLTGEAANAYMVSGIPVTFFINAEGRLVAQFVGGMSAETLEYYISLIYNG